MKPRQLIRTGFLLGEILLLIWVAAFIVGADWEGSPQDDLAAGPEFAAATAVLPTTELPTETQPEPAPDDGSTAATSVPTLTAAITETASLLPSPTQPLLPTVTTSPEPTATNAPTLSPTDTPTLEPTAAPTMEAEFEEIDLRSGDAANDGVYVSNPGMGWMYQGGTFPETYPAETVSYSRRSLISWMILNPADGVYNWTPLDDQLNTAISQGKQFSFRVYTMIGPGWGDAQVPDWVLAKGAVILSSGEPNYSNCTYQQEWGKFVNALRSRYDGNPDIAFIDISGYGEFNEWSWGDQTDWDYDWADAYASGTAGPSTMSLMDSYARRVLADMFVGGSFEGHECVDADDQVQTTNYDYPGFQNTQLVLPYAGIAQSTQYVFTKTQQVGFRFDCMGRADNDILGHVGAELSVIYQHAPVVYETCSANSFVPSEAFFLIENTHPSLIHDANLTLAGDEVLPYLEPLGYKYALTYLRFSTRGQVGQPLGVWMKWQNDGIAPSYPLMGQDFKLHLYLVNEAGQRVADMSTAVDVSAWMPSDTYGGTPPSYDVNVSPTIPGDVPAGVYSLDIEIVDERTGEPIWLPETVLFTSKVRGIVVTD